MIIGCRKNPAADILFPPEKPNCQPGANRRDGKHDRHRKQHISLTYPQEGVLHQCDALGQGEQANQLLHGLGHHFHRQGGAGEDEHGKI